MFIDLETKLILEEVAKLPKTTDTSYVVPDVLDLVRQRVSRAYDCRTNVSQGEGGREDGRGSVSNSDLQGENSETKSDYTRRFLSCVK